MEHAELEGDVVERAREYAGHRERPAQRVAEEREDHRARGEELQPRGLRWEVVRRAVLGDDAEDAAVVVAAAPAPGLIAGGVRRVEDLLFWIAICDEPAVDDAVR